MEQMISTAPAVITAERKPLRIYVAGSSTEAGRATRLIDRLFGAGMVVTHDWPAAVAKQRLRGGHPNRGMTRAQRVCAALDCIRGVMSCEVCVVLVPSHEAPTVGAYFEADRALTLGKLVVWVGSEDVSIFSALCAFTARDDEDAFALLQSLAAEHAS